MTEVISSAVSSQKFNSLKGMNDILPKDVPIWHQFEAHWRKLMQAYGYEEIRFPILEELGLFKRSIGEVTDIVEKEMFSFQRETETLALRPEGTAGCVRAGVEHGLLHNQIQRLWYMGPMFRAESPQLGRYRQFHQVGVESFGLPGPDIEVEHILMNARFWRWLGVTNSVTLEINSLGSLEARDQYRSKLVEYLTKYEKELDIDSKRRLKTNPLRILDSKNVALNEILAGAPQFKDYLDDASRIHFEQFQQRLNEAGIAYRLNSRLVRGLDYYNRTVYEWVTKEGLGAQATVCAGGRYDGLVQQLGGSKPTPAVGFAIGIERVLLLQRFLGFTQDFHPHAYLIYTGAGPEKDAFLVAEKLRDANPTLRLLVHSGGGNFKKQFEKADKSGATIALILGDTEWSTGSLGIKFLREHRPQLLLTQAEVGQFLTEYLGDKS